jgi:anti-sigma regulatory factor (Ser/Thr protein kinase)
MEDLSLHILDIAENSINAGAKNIEIRIRQDVAQDELTIEITDDGLGMEPENTEKATDPFYTTRTTRRVGLGLPLLAQATTAANGTLQVRSTPGQGTRVMATFQLSHIDRKPLGDMAATIVMLVASNPEIHFTYRYDHEFTFDTNEIKELLGGVDMSSPEALTFTRDYIARHMASFG